MNHVVFPWLIEAEDSMESFRQNVDQLSHVSPTWYSMKADLTIESKLKPEVVEIARQSGCKLVPLIVNEKFQVDVAHMILGTADSRSKAVDAIVQLVMDNDFAGINIDFEGPFVADRDNFSLFMRLLRERLPRDKELSVDVVPQQQAPTLTTTPSREHELEKWIQAWREPFDYQALGETVDHFMLMGYDYSGRLSKPGPVSPMWWLRKIIEYALQTIPKEKIVLGLPFYGRHWIVKPNGERSEGMMLTASEGRALAEKYGLEPQIDQDSLTYSLKWEEGGNSREAYYDDAETIKRKSQLVKDYGLAGVAFWRLGTEDPQVWAALKEVLR